jgi:hypothetical protein
MKESVNIYTSTCCGTQATKPPCVKARAVGKQPKKGKGRGKMFGEQQKAPEFATLGSWRCGSCGKPCKVTVSPRPPKEVKEAASAA